ncbi:Bax Inhibitor family protein [Mycena chlorophos]|uniref:Bax Inhibitor family protein n=1 Tax=Mycena chlorophos TaxID=658473 RepID=A0A8H6SJW9_MYCCL|nr:Bax Inhibitor family protein [Mycena chlorophos]
MLRVGLSTLRPVASRTAAAQLGARNLSSSSFRPNTILQTLQKQRKQFGSAFKYNTDSVIQPAKLSWRRVALIAGGVAGTVIVMDSALNRETRASLSQAERSLLNSTFAYTGAGLTVTAAIARMMYRSGFVFRIMAANPWVVVGASLVGGIGSIIGVQNTAPENTLLKHLFFLGFNTFQAATLAPLPLLFPATIMFRAGLYTLGVVGSLSYVGATAANDKYLMLGGPLLAGVTVVALSTLAPLVLPVTAVRALAITEGIYLYGGLAVFGGFVLYDTQKILMHARMAEAGMMKNDPMRESIGLQLDIINIFIRLVQILAMNNNKRK